MNVREIGEVYLVDDEAVVRDALAFLLGSRGLLVHTFGSGPDLSWAKALLFKIMGFTCSVAMARAVE